MCVFQIKQEVVMVGANVNTWKQNEVTGRIRSMCFGRLFRRVNLLVIIPVQDSSERLAFRAASLCPGSSVAQSKRSPQTGP